MPTYQRLGDVPRKRHIQFRDNGTLLTEEVMGLEGSGTLHTTFGDVPYREGDYVVIPRGTTYQFEPSGPQRYLLFETPGLIEIPKRYRNEYGQLMEHAPFYHRDIHPPTELKTYR